MASREWEKRFLDPSRRWTEANSWKTDRPGQGEAPRHPSSNEGKHWPKRRYVDNDRERREPPQKRFLTDEGFRPSSGYGRQRNCDHRPPQYHDQGPHGYSQEPPATDWKPQQTPNSRSPRYHPPKSPRSPDQGPPATDWKPQQTPNSRSPRYHPPKSPRCPDEKPVDVYLTTNPASQKSSYIKSEPVSPRYTNTATSPRYSDQGPRAYQQEPLTTDWKPHQSLSRSPRYHWPKSPRHHDQGPSNKRLRADLNSQNSFNFRSEPVTPQYDEKSPRHLDEKPVDVYLTTNPASQKSSYIKSEPVSPRYTNTATSPRYSVQGPPNTCLLTEPVSANFRSGPSKSPVYQDMRSPRYRDRRTSNKRPLTDSQSQQPSGARYEPVKSPRTPDMRSPRYHGRAPPEFLQGHLTKSPVYHDGRSPRYPTANNQPNVATGSLAASQPGFTNSNAQTQSPGQFCDPRYQQYTPQTNAGNMEPHGAKSLAASQPGFTNSNAQTRSPGQFCDPRYQQSTPQTNAANNQPNVATGSLAASQPGFTNSNAQTRSPGQFCDPRYQQYTPQTNVGTFPEADSSVKPILKPPWTYEKKREVLATVHHSKPAHSPGQFDAKPTANDPKVQSPAVNWKIVSGIQRIYERELPASVRGMIEVPSQQVIEPPLPPVVNQVEARVTQVPRLQVIKPPLLPVVNQVDAEARVTQVPRLRVIKPPLLPVVNQVDAEAPVIQVPSLQVIKPPLPPVVDQVDAEEEGLLSDRLSLDDRLRLEFGILVDTDHGEGVQKREKAVQNDGGKPLRRASVPLEGVVKREKGIDPGKEMAVRNDGEKRLRPASFPIEGGVKRKKGIDSEKEKVVRNNGGNPLLHASVTPKDRTQRGTGIDLPPEKEKAMRNDGGKQLYRASVRLKDGVQPEIGVDMRPVIEKAVQNNGGNPFRHAFITVKDVLQQKFEMDVSPKKEKDEQCDGGKPLFRGSVTPKDVVQQEVEMDVSPEKEKGELCDIPCGSLKTDPVPPVPASSSSLWNEVYWEIEGLTDELGSYVPIVRTAPSVDPSAVPTEGTILLQTAPEAEDQSLHSALPEGSASQVSVTASAIAGPQSVDIGPTASIPMPQDSLIADPHSLDIPPTACTPLPQSVSYAKNSSEKSVDRGSHENAPVEGSQSGQTVQPDLDNVPNPDFSIDLEMSCLTQNGQTSTPGPDNVPCPDFSLDLELSSLMLNSSSASSVSLGDAPLSLLDSPAAGSQSSDPKILQVKSVRFSLPDEEEAADDGEVHLDGSVQGEMKNTLVDNCRLFVDWVRRVFDGLTFEELTNILKTQWEASSSH